MKKFLKAVENTIMFILGFDCETRRSAVDEGLCDFGGQGKDEYGR